jgi:hypothetical protein
MFERIRDAIPKLASKDAVWWMSKLKIVILNYSSITFSIYYAIKRDIFDVAAKLGIYEYKYNIIFIAGMPMSATTWVKNFLGRLPGYFTRYTPMPDSVAGNQDISESAFNHVPHYGYTLFKTHLNPTENNLKIITNNNVKKIIVTYRDFRDVAIARYHRLIMFPKRPTDPNYVDTLKMTKEEAINESISIIASHYVNWIDGWFDMSIKHKDFIYFCEFENLRADPKKEFMKILEFYEITLPMKQFDIINEASKGKSNMGDNLKKAPFLPWALSSNFRLGIVGGWKDHFTEENKRYFKNMVGDDLVRYGYENNNNW